MGDLTSREQVIEAIEETDWYHIYNGALAQGASDEDEALYKATDVYKAIENVPSAEPHTFTVIDTKTGKEADTYKIALKEEWAKGLCYCDMEGFAIEEDGTLILLDECGRCAYCPQGRFEVEWDG